MQVCQRPLSVPFIVRVECAGVSAPLSVPFIVRVECAGVSAPLSVPFIVRVECAGVSAPLSVAFIVRVECAGVSETTVCCFHCPSGVCRCVSTTVPCIVPVPCLARNIPPNLYLVTEPST